MKLPAEWPDRFASKVRSSEGCWLWIGASCGHKRGNSYGLFWLNGKNEHAHRVAFILTHGSIPADRPRILHRCDTPACVRPDHLYATATPEGERVVNLGGARVPGHRHLVARDPRERFWGRVQKSDGCWLWTGRPTRTRQGGNHGNSFYNGRPDKAHRVAYMLEVGPIPRGMCVLHRCDNPPCVRPDHLYIGTHADNMRDLRERGVARR